MCQGDGVESRHSQRFLALCRETEDKKTLQGAVGRRLSLAANGHKGDLGPKASANAGYVGLTILFPHRHLRGPWENLLDGVIMSVQSTCIGILKHLSARTGLMQTSLFRVYPYMFTPQQLHFLTLCLVETRDVPGCVVEAGCAYGATTAFLNNFMASEQPPIRREYFAIDTFSGFLDEHSSFEISKRGKTRDLAVHFKDNSKNWFNCTMHVERLGNVRSISEDIVKFDFCSIDKIAFCLLDIDLYIPIKAVLPRIYDRLAAGGILVVDDCASGGFWDGALQAYQEYCVENNLTAEIHCGKLGVIRKNLSQRHALANG